MCDGPGSGGMPEGSTEGTPGRRSRDAGHAGEDGGGISAAGCTEQRVYGDGEVAALGNDFAAGGRNADVDHSAQRRACEGGAGSDDDRSAATAGDGGFADGDGAAEEGDVLLRRGRT